MRNALRVGALTALAGLTATVLLLRPGAPPAVTAAAQQVAGNGILEFIPPDAVGFIDVRAADLWKNDIFAGFRQMFERAGPKAHAALDSQFVPKPSTFDRLSAFLLLDDRMQPLPYIVLQFSAAFNPT